jgi:PAS domain-containing protein
MKGIFGRARRAVNHMARNAALHESTGVGTTGTEPAAHPTVDSRSIKTCKLRSGHEAGFFGYIDALPQPRHRTPRPPRGVRMTHPIEIILTRQLAEYLSVPVFLVDPKGDLLFYNEPAEIILGRRFEETGGRPAEVWSKCFTPMDDQDRPIAPEDLPLVMTLATRLPAHKRFRIVGQDGISRRIEVTAIPIAGLRGGFLGAAALFWELGP